MTKFKPTQNIV